MPKPPAEVTKLRGGFAHLALSRVEVAYRKSWGEPVTTCRRFVCFRADLFNDSDGFQLKSLV
jgi:hypothetical protein